MRRLIPPPGARVGAALVVALAMLFAALIVRSFAVTSTDTRLCVVIRTLVVRSGRPPTNAPAYYAEHPEELAKAQATYDNAISQLGDCRHLPTG